MNRASAPRAFRRRGVALLLIASVLGAGPALAAGASGTAASPPIGFSLNLPAANDLPSTLHLLLMLTMIGLAPSLLIVMTCFTRFVIVFSLLRTALGTPQTPPNQVLVGLALFMTLFVMAPTLNQVHADAVQPYLAKQINTDQALTRGMQPLRDFMLKQTRANDLALFVHLSRRSRPGSADDIPSHIVIPAFILSELRTGFLIGFIIAIPFLVIDLVVASTIMSMGMMMLPPVLISLPFKVLLFVMVDGWHLLLRGLVLSVS